MNNRKKQLLTTLITTGVVTLLIASILIRRSIPNGGELTSNYELLRSLDEPLQYLTLSSAIAFPISLAVTISTFTRATPPQTKLQKYNAMRKLALWIGAIPGIVLLPLALAMAAQNTPIDEIMSYLAVLTMAALFPGGMGMIVLSCFATIRAIKTPLDPDSPTPKTQLIQIWLASVLAAMPTTAFFSIFINSGKCDTQVCTPMFQDPLSFTLGAIYLTIWLALGFIWLKTKQNHGKLDS